MGKMNDIISFGIIFIVGNKLMEETMDELYPNRYKGFFENLMLTIRKRG